MLNNGASIVKCCWYRNYYPSTLPWQVLLKHTVTVTQSTHCNPSTVRHPPAYLWLASVTLIEGLRFPHLLHLQNHHLQLVHKISLLLAPLVSMLSRTLLPSVHFYFLNRFAHCHLYSQTALLMIPPSSPWISR